MTPLLLLTLGFSLIQPATPSYQAETRNLAGWKVRVHPRLSSEQRGETDRAIRLLEDQLRQIVRRVRKDRLVKLQKVSLWLSPEYPGIPPRAEYHPSATWLQENGRDPAMAKGIEFTNIRIFEAETRRMPNFAMHELAHAYHDQVLGNDQPQVIAAFQKAKASGRYEKVEQRFGDGRTAINRAYAMTNPQEYFAETTEAYFFRNDFFPFNRDELKKHDPEMFSLLQMLWDEVRS